MSVAANAVLGFVEPTSSGLGGDCFAFVWDPKAAKLMGMASSGRSPKSLSLEMVRPRRARTHSVGWSGERFNSRRAGRMVGAARALRDAEVGGAV